MPQKSLLTNPLYRPEDLGRRLPETVHSVSMCLPRWQDVVGYETNDPVTMAALSSGYPRFFYHPLVREAFDFFARESDGQIQIYATLSAAQRCRDYLLKQDPEARITCRSIEGCSAAVIAFPSDSAVQAKAYWQHTGEGISSRHAELLLAKQPLPPADAARDSVLKRVAESAGVSVENVFLFPNGMAAIYMAFRIARALFADRPSVQFAFPYSDTLKMQEKMGAGLLFYPGGNADDLSALENQLKKRSISSLFCEFPTNPLLTCVDLPRLRALADQYQFPLIVDETLAACTNVDLLPLADACVISLTKFFAGSGDVLGGALILNPSAPFAGRFKALLETMYEPEAYCSADLIELARVSGDVKARVSQINQTAAAVCDFLKHDNRVEQVFYPVCDESGMYDQLKRPDGGYGGVLSFVLKDAARVTEGFYDALKISKGPNLGTSFSLCCPFVLLAHYDELEWAESAGASRYLIRISIGLEPAEELIARIAQALGEAVDGMAVSG